MFINRLKKNCGKSYTKIYKGLLISAVSLLILNSYGQENMGEKGLVIQKSANNVEQTVAKATTAIEEKGLNIFAVINHQENAEKFDLSLAPTTLILFGNPKVGTPLMNCAPTMAIDLPQKFLVFEDKDGDVKLAYNDIDYLAKQHDIKGCDEVLAKVKNVLSGLSAQAVQ